MIPVDYERLYRALVSDFGRLQAKYEYLKTAYPETYRKVEDAFSNS